MKFKRGSHISNKSDQSNYYFDLTSLKRAVDDFRKVLITNPDLFLEEDQIKAALTMKAFPPQDISIISQQIATIFPKVFVGDILENVLFEYATPKYQDQFLMKRHQNETYLRICMHMKSGEIGFYKLKDVIEKTEQEIVQSDELSRKPLPDNDETDANHFIPAHLKEILKRYPHAIALDSEIHLTAYNDLFTIVRIKMSNDFDILQIVIQRLFVDEKPVEEVLVDVSNQIKQLEGNFYTYVPNLKFHTLDISHVMHNSQIEPLMSIFCEQICIGLFENPFTWNGVDHFHLIDEENLLQPVITPNQEHVARLMDDIYNLAQDKIEDFFDNVSSLEMFYFFVKKSELKDEKPQINLSIDSQDQKEYQVFDKAYAEFQMQALYFFYYVFSLPNIEKFIDVEERDNFLQQSCYTSGSRSLDFETIFIKSISKYINNILKDLTELSQSVIESMSDK